MRRSTKRTVVNPVVLEELVEPLLENLSGSHTWRCDPTLGWVNNHSTSLRNPEDRTGPLSAQEFARLRAFTDLLERYLQWRPSAGERR